MVQPAIDAASRRLGPHTESCTPTLLHLIFFLDNDYIYGYGAPTIELDILCGETASCCSYFIYFHVKLDLNSGREAVALRQESIRKEAYDFDLPAAGADST